MSAWNPSQQRSMSNQRPALLRGSESKGKENATETPFQPCATTPSLFLYAEGSTVICLHHDSLSIERQFQKHETDVQFICVDNVSERGASRLVVTYDVGKTAIVWDLFTGEQLSRFASYEPLTVAAWMRNGNLAFGNEKGEIILFEPATSEHVSARTIFDPITAIAPSSDCKTYAIGYRNGSILLASLQPVFTILHTLTTTRGPSPIAGLMWHASSSKQKSDMLATHTVDGDLRVWSVAKAPSVAAPRVIRALRQQESSLPARSWISWSKNGRILQFSNEEMWVWDVRTKDVTYEPIPIIDAVQGLAAYGPSGTLFTMGPDFTIQQYDVDAAQMVANVRHMPATIPQTPPQENSQPTFNSESEGEYPTSNSQSKLTAYATEAAKMERSRVGTPQSRTSRDELGESYKQIDTMSPATKTDRTTTTISVGVQSTLSKATYSPATNKSGRKASRLRQEIIRSPEERPIPDLFPFIRARLSDVPYRQARDVDETRMTSDDLRKQMISVVFGWDDDIRTLINDELSRIPAQSSHAVYLTRWLQGDAEYSTDLVSSTNGNSTLDWMRLALSCIGNAPESKHVAQAFVERMLTQGDVHAAVAILLASGDFIDAIEVYVSRNLHMEAVLLTCLVMPTEWQRQSFLVRKWGEHVVQNNEQHLAVRCFSCTGVDSTEPWPSPRAQMAASVPNFVAPILQPSIYHKIMERRGMEEAVATNTNPNYSVSYPKPGTTGARATPQISALKLVTSFDGKDHFRFPGLVSDEGTPINAALITPIAESAAPRSAISPGGMGSYRANNMRSLNTIMASRTATPNLHRNRLPSIGETPIEVEASSLPANLVPRAPPTPADSGSDKERERTQTPADNQKLREELPLLLTPARYEPPGISSTKSPQTAILKLRLNNGSENRNLDVEHIESRNRKPDGLSIRMFSVAERSQSEEQLSSLSYGESIDRPSTTESTNSMQPESIDFTESQLTGNSYNSQRGLKSPSVTGRSLDQYISSLEQAQYYKPRPRGNSLSSKQSRDDVDKRGQRQQTTTESQGRGELRNVLMLKRSPSSPVPMSPDELRKHTTSMESFDSAYLSTIPPGQLLQSTIYPGEREQKSSHSAVGEHRKHRSRSRQPEGRGRNSSRAPSRQPSMERTGQNRGRSKSRREESMTRQGQSYDSVQLSEEDRDSVSSVEPALRIVSANRQRLQTESERHRERGTSSSRHAADRKSQRLRSRSRQPEAFDATLSRKSSSSRRADRSQRHAESSQISRDDPEQPKPAHSGRDAQPMWSDLTSSRSANSQFVDGGRRTKELAQAELEARRLSLARRPSAPAVPFPNQLSAHDKTKSVEYAPPLLRAQTDTTTATRSAMSPHPNAPEYNPFARSRPTTPRAMKHPSHQESDVPDVPKAGELLTSSTYQPLRSVEPPMLSARTYKGETYYNPEIPTDMPIHAAFDANINLSRPTSKNHAAIARRDVSQERGMFRDQPNTLYPKDVQVVTVGEEDYSGGPIGYNPPVVPELQHLAVPPPPPLAPLMSREMLEPNGLRNQRSDLPGMTPNEQRSYSAQLPEIISAMSPVSASSSRHRRGRSGNESQLIGKIRHFTGRMRSTSRGRSTSRNRDNAARSPQIGSDDAYSPYESLASAQQAHQQLATVVEGR